MVTCTIPPFRAAVRLNSGVSRYGTSTMTKFAWSKLNNQQVGAYTEYFVKMELTLHGFQVYTTEVDDRGIDFVARHESGPFLQIQVKSLRSYNYVFMPKSKFQPHEHTFLALGLLIEDLPPDLYLIPSMTWATPNAVFRENNYEGLKSSPEWGINISKKNLPSLAPFAFHKVIDTLVEG